MASVVTRAPLSSRRSSRAGMAVISLGFLSAGLLAEHQAPARGPGGDQVQRVAALGSAMTAPGGLTVDGDDIGIGVAQLVDPCREAGLETIGRQGVDDAVKRVMRGGYPFQRAEKWSSKRVVDIRSLLNSIPHSESHNVN